jgi:hypothetical protein
MELDEGALTAAVIAPYAAEDGKRGQAAAEAVLPLRRALWRTLETYAPVRLAACLRVRADAADQTGRGGVRELRQALADWLDPPPACKFCRRPIVHGSDKVGCPARRPRMSATSAQPRRLVCIADTRPAEVRSGREARCGTLALFSPTLSDPHVIAAWAKFSGAADVVCDRDGRALLAASAPVGARLPPAFSQALAVLPAAPPIVAAARRRFDRAVNDAVTANGRLILATQVKYYKASGATMRADLVQGAAMGLRRALMDYDHTAVHKNGMTARISSYSIPWIRQGAGEAYAERDLLGTPDWVGTLRRKIEAAGVEMDTGMTPATLLRAALHLAEAACAGPAIKLVSRLTISRALVDMLLDPATVEFDRSWGAVVVLVAATVPAFKVIKTDSPSEVKAKAEKREEHAAERVLAWACGVLEVEGTGSGILAALRHGAPVYISTLATGADDEDDANPAGRHETRAGVEAQQALSSAQEDFESILADEDEAAEKWRRASAAMEELRKVDPEAAEVIRRRRGLDGLGEEEALESIASTGITCTGRAICRESVRQLQKRGEGVLRRRAAAPATTAPA